MAYPHVISRPQVEKSLLHDYDWPDGGQTFKPNFGLPTSWSSTGPLQGFLPLVEMTIDLLPDFTSVALSY